MKGPTALLIRKACITRFGPCAILNGCPGECWQRFRLLYASRMVNIPVHSAWIEFDSAFGGLAIYSCKALMAGH